MSTVWAYLSFVLSLFCFSATLWFLATGVFSLVLEDLGDAIVVILLLAGGPVFLMVGPFTPIALIP